MTPLLILLGAIFLLLAIGTLRRLSPTARRRLLASVAVALGLVLLLVLVIRGGLHPLAAALGGGLLLLQRLYAAKQIFDRVKSARGPGAGANSQVSTRFLDMSLDHDSGEMRGTVREGRFAGRSLSQMSLEELLELHAQCRAQDAQSLAVLESWLDRAHGDVWRARAQSGAESDDGEQRAAEGGPMSVSEAREILEVGDGASREDVIAAHRRLMQKLHPDRGGSTWLASKINQAKDVLLDAL